MIDDVPLGPAPGRCQMADIPCESTGRQKSAWFANWPTMECWTLQKKLGPPLQIRVGQLGRFNRSTPIPSNSPKPAPVGLQSPSISSPNTSATAGFSRDADWPTVRRPSKQGEDRTRSHEDHFVFGRAESHGQATTNLDERESQSCGAKMFGRFALLIRRIPSSSPQLTTAPVRRILDRDC